MAVHAVQGGRRAPERKRISPTFSWMAAVGMVVAGAAQIPDDNVRRVAVTSSLSVVAKLTVKLAEAGKVGGLLEAAKTSLAVVHSDSALGYAAVEVHQGDASKYGKEAQ